MKKSDFYEHLYRDLLAPYRGSTTESITIKIYRAANAEKNYKPKIQTTLLANKVPVPPLMQAIPKPI